MTSHKGPDQSSLKFSHLFVFLLVLCSMFLIQFVLQGCLLMFCPGYLLTVDNWSIFFGFAFCDVINSNVQKSWKSHLLSLRFLKTWHFVNSWSGNLYFSTQLCLCWLSTFDSLKKIVSLRPKVCVFRTWSTAWRGPELSCDACRPSYAPRWMSPQSTMAWSPHNGWLLLASCCLCCLEDRCCPLCDSKA